MIEKNTEPTVQDVLAKLDATPVQRLQRARHQLQHLLWKVERLIQDQAEVLEEDAYQIEFDVDNAAEVIEVTYYNFYPEVPID